jgi:tetratricopeptide (TPR) repeat protein
MHFFKLKIKLRSAACVCSLFLSFLIPLIGASLQGQTTQPTLTLTGYVNDFAGVIDPATKQNLESLLTSFKERAGVDFAVVTVKSTGAEEIFDYSQRVARGWGINSKPGKPKAILLLVSVDDQKRFTHVTKSLESVLPDGLLGEVSNRVARGSRAGDYSEALTAAVQTVVATLSEKLGSRVEGVDRRYVYGQPSSGASTGGTPAAVASSPSPSPPAESSANEVVPGTPAPPALAPLPANNSEPVAGAPGRSSGDVAAATTGASSSSTGDAEARRSATGTPTSVPASAAPASTPTDTGATGSATGAGVSPSPTPTSLPAGQSSTSTAALGTSPPASNNAGGATPSPSTPDRPDDSTRSPTPSNNAAATPSPVVDSDSAPSSPSPTPSKSAATHAPSRSHLTKKSSDTAESSSSPEDEEEEVETTLAKPLAERIEVLKAFIQAHPTSPFKARANELILGARAGIGDQKLKAGDVAGGVDIFRQVIAESPADMSDSYFTGVLGQLPTDLFVRNQPAFAFEIARLIEARAKDNPKRLLTLADFYLKIESSEEASRIAEAAIKLAPDLAAAHQALGAARHIALRLDDAAAEYARALELDPKSPAARRALADLRRAAGKADQALLLYREQLKADPKDQSARAGMVLSLFDLGRRVEAEAELSAALSQAPHSIALLVGAAYWYVAHNDYARALDFAGKAMNIEPRYTWAHIALARALVANRRPLEAERGLRYARQYGKFPTLDYELASTLAAAGLYQEASVELRRSFSLRDGQIETQLAGRTPARAANFIDLLAPERRASIFQPNAAESESNARMLRGLLALTIALESPAGPNRESDALAGAQEFADGQDAMRVYRQLYAASRLLAHGLGTQKVLELTEAAPAGVEAGLDLPVASVAVLADELAEIRASAIAAGDTPDFPTVDRGILSKIIRGNIEDLAGWALFNRNQNDEAIVRLRRAVNVLPINSAWAREALWHLGTALSAKGDKQEALNTYIKSYISGSPDFVRRAVVERLYREVHGSIEGLDSKIGVAGEIGSSVSAAPSPAENAATGAIPPVANSPDHAVSPSPAGATQSPTEQPPSSNSGGKDGARSDGQQRTDPPVTGGAANPAPATDSPGGPGALKEGDVTLQVGTYSEAAQADERAAHLAAGGIEARAVKVDTPQRGTLYKVVIGRFKSRAEAAKYGEELRGKKLILDYVVADLQEFR